MRIKNIIKRFALVGMLAVSMFVSGCGGGGSEEPFALRFKEIYQLQANSPEVVIVVDSNKELAIVPGGFVRGTISVTNAAKPARFYAEPLGPNRDSVRLHFIGEKGAGYTVLFELIDVSGETKILYVTFDTP